MSVPRPVALACAALVACAALTLVLGVQLNRTRGTLQADGVLEFNFVQQLDHDFDAFAHALGDRLDAGRGVDAHATALAERAWRERFDVLYSAVVTIDRRWAGSVLDDPAGRAASHRMQGFVERVARRIDADPDATPAPAWLDATRRESRELSADVYAVGLDMYQAKSLLRDRVAARMDWLSRASWLSGAGFALAGLALVTLLGRASRRATRLVAQTRAAQAQLEAAHAELTDGDLARKGQNRFLAQATHDLRQPLQAMQYYLAALGAHVDGERGAEILERIGRSTDAAQRLLVELLDISKLDAGVLQARRAPTDLDELLARLHDAVRPEAAARGLELHVDRPGLWVDTDGSLLARILGNLLSNALAYTREGGVRVEVVRAGADAHGVERAVIGVIDTGIGIPPAEREAIFDEYYRLDGPDRDPERGIGIGLAIVRRLARLLDIPVRVDSASGRGTRFELTLPLVAAPLAAPGRGARPPTLGRATLAGLLVLVIDDEPDVREGVAALLEQQGCTVVPAENATEALARLVDASLVPDLIVADYRLRDGRTGVEAIERVRDEVNEEVPAIVVTGDTAPERLREAAASGLPLLHKPVDAERLFEAMGESAGLAA